MADVLKIAEYLINSSYYTGKELDQLKLQGLLFLAQAYSLSSDECGKQPLFEDDILAWQFGAKIKKAYEKWNHFHCSVLFAETEPKSPKLRPHQLRACSTALKHFGNYTGLEIMNIIHFSKPWKEAYESKKSNIVSKKSLEEWFKNEF